ncbi:hypothetical protein NLG97_g5209 [Lecanicillium saksenae]|uniref:Uncharacterized protein n=1 Tax=Lecanicillium saksenae TaxID=468837 RepID=A0ACC1QUA1_9HYPO|nr:hypothetical protein NLG97_g5209 [Lecanicillium saksenae]
MAASESVSITYVPADCGSVIPGKSKAPKAFRDVGIVRKLREAGVPSVTEYHALDQPARFSPSTWEPGGARNEEINIAVCEKVRRSMEASLRAVPTGPDFQLILGGECCMLPGLVSAYWDYASAQSPPKRVGLVYIDADTDLTSSIDPTSTGTFAGMTMVHLAGLSGELPKMRQFARATGEAVCDATNTVFFGTNMSSPGNKPSHFQYMFDQNYKVVSSNAVADAPKLRATEALRYLEENVDTIIVHLDVDSIDPGTFPLANVPNYTGVEFESMMAALGVFLSSDKTGGLVIAEANPDHDPGLDMFGKLVDAIAKMLGNRLA